MINLAEPRELNGRLRRVQATAPRPDSLGDQHSVARLFSHAVGDARSTLKCAGRTARLLEEQFITDGWPVGRVYGCEGELAERYGVGRAIVRETARILEARGTARMRRGRNGGLGLKLPSTERLHDMIGGYCYLAGVSHQQLQTARTVLDRVAAYIATERKAHLEFVPLLDRQVMDAPDVGRELRRLLTAAAGNPAHAFCSDTLDQLMALQLPQGSRDPRTKARAGHLARCIDRLVIAISRGSLHAAAAWAGACSRRVGSPVASGKRATAANPASSARDSLDRTRAGQIVRTLIKDVGPGQWTDGRNLGNEMELSERYGVDRAVVRQAIRILEAAETAASLPGRGRGLVARTPGAASISRLICCHFAANRVGYFQCFQVFKWLGVEMTALAARHANPAALERISVSLAALTQRADTVLLSDLIAIEEQQFALANNRVLDLFLRSAKAFPTWAMHGNLPVPRGALDDFLECSVAVTAAIEARNPVAAAAAQEVKFMRLQRNIDSVFENFRSGSIALSPAAGG